MSRRTLSRILAQLQLNRRTFSDPSGESNREPQKIIAVRPGHMVHVDVKKVGRVPDGGGWPVRSEASPQARRTDEDTRNANRLRLPCTPQSTGTRGSPTARHCRMSKQ